VPDADSLLVEVEAHLVSALGQDSGRAGVAGPPVVTLRAPSNGRIAECVPVARTLARAMLTNPRAFYVNIHSEAFPTGAVRGQLRR